MKHIPAKRSSEGRSAPSAWRDRAIAPLLPLAERLMVSASRFAVPRLGALAGDLYQACAARERRIFARNATRILGLAPGSAEFIALRRGVFRHAVCGAWETLKAFHHPELVVVEGLARTRAQFEQAERRGQGQLLLTAHLGSWEMIELLVTPLLRGKFVELAKPSRIVPVNRTLERLRRRAGTEVLWTGGGGYVRRMVEVLLHGHTLALAMDQKPEQLIGPVVDFFGRPTEFVAGPAHLISRFRPTVLFVTCTRLAPFVYRLECETVEFSAQERADEVLVTQRLAHLLERSIRACPEQWPWNYRRWIFEDEGWRGPRGRDRTSAAWVAR